MISGLREDATIEHAEHAGHAGSCEEFVVRKAGMHDIGPILGLINGYAAKGIMLPRTELEVSEDIRDFSVIVTAGRLVGCGALRSEEHTSELQSLRPSRMPPSALKKTIILIPGPNTTPPHTTEKTSELQVSA